MMWIKVLVDDDDVRALQDQEGLGLYGEMIVFGGPESMYEKQVNVYDFGLENPYPGLPK